MEFQQVILAYRAGLPNALDGVSFTVYPGEKVGIVGRTGSGKSTLFLALFRMVELKAGRILLDGVDSQLVGLEELRYRGLSSAGGSWGEGRAWKLRAATGWMPKGRVRRKGLTLLSVAVSHELLCCFCRTA